MFLGDTTSFYIDSRMCYIIFLKEYCCMLPLVLTLVI